MRLNTSIVCDSTSLIPQARALLTEFGLKLEATEPAIESVALLQAGSPCRTPGCTGEYDRQHSKGQTSDSLFVVARYWCCECRTAVKQVEPRKFTRRKS